MLNSNMISSSSLNSHTPTTPFIHHHLLATHNSLQKPFILLLKEWERWEERVLRKKCVYVFVHVCMCVCIQKGIKERKCKGEGYGSVPPTYTHCTCRTAGSPSWKINTLISVLLTHSPALNPPCPLLATVLTQTHSLPLSLSLSLSLFHTHTHTHTHF